ncbi:unnamed protein product [Caenorhabditis auriculariae]|uniref:Uncharacterized protein n=1 Tax=Caenorhabditis auriculariae TaxID=2777116 RepID=A0A8S1GXA9_9PELO|nr:unnamed protein product [Caenorhabditis auriculariae]
MSTLGRLKQAYLALIPVYPIGYVLVHGFRGDQIWARPYVDRSSEEPSQQLKELVESELDKVDNVKKAKTNVVLTDEIEPKVFGGLFLTSGAELQFPHRVSLVDVEQARRHAANLELDLGLSKYRKKVEVNSAVGEELISRLMLSDAAKMFLVQRQLQIANSGEFFSVSPFFAWFGISAVGYGVFVVSAMTIGAVPAFLVATTFSVLVFRRFLGSFDDYKMKKADEITIRKGETYAQGARDYFDSSMKLNRLLRTVLGDDGETNIKKNGDCSLHSHVPFSTRRRLVDKIAAEVSATETSS